MAQRKLPMLVCLGLIVVTMQGQTARPAPEQTEFSPDYGHPIQHEVPVSPGVLRVLLKSPEVRDTLQDAKESAQHATSQLFTTAEVHLGPAKEIDLVVYGISPMTGGDNDWFWIVLSARKNPKVVLFAGGSSLEVMSSRTNGYRDIRSGWASASQASTKIYKFNGRTYKLWKERWHEVRPEKR